MLITRINIDYHGHHQGYDIVILDSNALLHFGLPGKLMTLILIKLLSNGHARGSNFMVAIISPAPS